MVCVSLAEPARKAIAVVTACFLEIAAACGHCQIMHPPLSEHGRIRAVLGPTNTGKTHFAMERMLAHATGMIGFPLRLLARENYDRAVAIKGEHAVGLITGEEKILPKGARWLLCTVESMPLERNFGFVGVDEIQMCADPDRGHIFTDRLLNARGLEETMFMGADTIRPLLTRLIPDAEIITRPRFSTLTHTGPKKVSRLPRRSAVVAFTASNVYALAELIRRQRGGAAVVLGALSPRTRNAQVAMYQAGEVDYLVATDAIGMGLNMDVDHVAFASLKKFDGRRQRRLTAAELAQVAGRAGRHMNDGTFGTTAEAGILDDDIAAKIENHEFEPLQSLFWRNADLDFSSVAALRNSLTRPPSVTGLKRARTADDEMILERLNRDEDIRHAAKGHEAVRLLWDVCQIPDFRGVMSDAHAGLVEAVYRHLTGPEGCLPTDWVAGNVARLDRVDGDMDTLIGRIAGIRTWTYVSYRADWVADAAGWQAKTRAIEDKLSDALHDRLTQRFVDRKTSVLVAKLKDSPDLMAGIKTDGDVLIEGEHVGRVEGLRFRFEAPIEGDAGRAVANAALRAVRGELVHIADRLVAAPDTAFALTDDEDGAFPKIAWQGAPVGRFACGPQALRPEIAVIADDALAPAERDRVQARLRAWAAAAVDTALGDLVRLQAAPLTGAARGLAYQLLEGFGSLDRDDAKAQIDALSRDDRKLLREYGVRLGRDMAFLPSLLKPEAVRWRAILWSLVEGRKRLGALPTPGRVSVPLIKGSDRALLAACGYRTLGPLAVRADMAERLTSRAWTLSKGGSFAPPPDLMTLIGANTEQFPKVMQALGFRRTQRTTDDGATLDLYRPMRGGGQKRSKPEPPAPKVNEHSPFAKLRDLAVGGRR